MTQKKLFILAYVWMFGETKKRAEQIYKKANESYIKEVINGYRQQTQKAFYND